VTRNNKTQSYLYVGLNTIDGVTNPFEYLNRKESINLTQDDRKKVIDFLIQKKGKELDSLVELLAPSIVGNEHVKKGFLLQLAN